MRIHLAIPRETFLSHAALWRNGASIRFDSRARGTKESASMKTMIAATFIAALGFAGAAQAMSVAPIEADGLTPQVAQGCGPGMARNAAGRCRPAYMTRPCPPGMRRNYV